MNEKKITPPPVEELLDSLSQIETVELSQDFKEKVLKKFDEQRAQVIEFLPWFTTKYQVAAVFFFLFLNLSALILYNENVSEQKSETLAEAYGISYDESDIENLPL